MKDGKIVNQIKRCLVGVCDETCPYYHYEDNLCVSASEFLPIAEEFLNKAIQALEEIQQYRAIGTVEGYERAIRSSIENYNLYREYKAKVGQFEAIGTLEEVKVLKEKNEAKKPIEHEENKIGKYYSCPTCRNNSLDDLYDAYCPRCGQRLDWFGENSMSDEELEKKCAEAIDRIMTDNSYFLHLLIKAMEIRCERLVKIGKEGRIADERDI